MLHLCVSRLYTHIEFLYLNDIILGCIHISSDSCTVVEVSDPLLSLSGVYAVTPLAISPFSFADSISLRLLSISRALILCYASIAHAALAMNSLNMGGRRASITKALAMPLRIRKGSTTTARAQSSEVQIDEAQRAAASHPERRKDSMERSETKYASEICIFSNLFSKLTAL